MPYVFDASFKETTQVGTYDKAAEQHFGSAVLNLGLPRPDSWCKYGWASATGAVSDYLLKVGDIGILGGFELGFDWDEHPFAEYGVYVWPVTMKAEIDTNPLLSVLDGVRLADQVRSAGNHRVVVSARVSQNHHATAYVSFDRKIEIVGDTIYYRVSDIETFNFGSPDDNGEYLELGGALAAASIQIRADWAVLQYYVDKAKRKAKIVPVVITDKQEPTSFEVMFYELMRVAIDQLYDNHGDEVVLDFEEPQLSFTPSRASMSRDVSRARANEIVLAETDLAFKDELTYHCHSVERTEPYDAVSGLFDIEDQAENHGNEALLNVARNLLVKIGFYRVMSPLEIASTVTSDGRHPWDFKLNGVAYTSDSTVEEWSLDSLE